MLKHFCLFYFPTACSLVQSTESYVALQRRNACQGMWPSVPQQIRARLEDFVQESTLCLKALLSEAEVTLLWVRTLSEFCPSMYSQGTERKQTVYKRTRKLQAGFDGDSALGALSSIRAATTPNVKLCTSWIRQKGSKRLIRVIVHLV